MKTTDVQLYRDVTSAPGLRAAPRRSSARLTSTIRLVKWWLLLLAMWFSPVLAPGPAIAQQQTCPDMQDTAIANIVTHCAEQTPGMLCFGHPTVSIMGLPGARGGKAKLRVRQPGDLVPLSSIDWFSASSEDRTWGTARVIVPAYSADGLDARAVTLLLFGDVALSLPEVNNLPAALVDIEVTVTRGANLRAEPNIDARVITTVAEGTLLKAVRRSDDGEWIEVYFNPVQLGWISQSVVTGDVNSLGINLPEITGLPIWFHWQSFDFRSGIVDAPCDGATSSGILMQTPEFVAPRQFVLNGLNLRLSGTAFLQAQVAAGMWIYVLEGEAEIAAADASVVVRGGSFTYIAFAPDADGAPIALEAPTEPDAYDYHSMLVLPIQALPNPTRVGLDAYSIIRRRPSDGNSPLSGMTANQPCKITAGTFGANIRSEPRSRSAYHRCHELPRKRPACCPCLGQRQSALVETGGERLDSH